MVNDESKNTESFNAVSHPAHYIAGRKYEPRKVIADWGLNFNLGNAEKKKEIKERNNGGEKDTPINKEVKKDEE